MGQRSITMCTTWGIVPTTAQKEIHYGLTCIFLHCMTQTLMTQLSYSLWNMSGSVKQWLAQGLPVGFTAVWEFEPGSSQSRSNTLTITVHHAGNKLPNCTAGQCITLPLHYESEYWSSNHILESQCVPTWGYVGGSDKINCCKSC